MCSLQHQDDSSLGVPFDALDEPFETGQTPFPGETQKDIHTTGTKKEWLTRRLALVPYIRMVNLMVMTSERRKITTKKRLAREWETYFLQIYGSSIVKDVPRAQEALWLRR